RFLGAGFLMFWLAGWAAGETFALWAVASGVRSLFTSGPPSPLEADHHSIQVQSAVPLALGLFILGWLIFWTFAGVAAGSQLLRLLFGRDRILVKDDGLEIEQRYGWFRSRKWFPRHEVRRFYRKTPGTALPGETSKTTITLTDLGTPADREQLEGTLNAAFQFSGPPAPEPALPGGWCEVRSPEGDSVLVKDPAIRRKQARTARIACIVLIGILLYLVSASAARSDLLGA